jgi:hypothetical protein
MNRIVLVLYSLFISFAVDLIHFIFYFNFVTSSWCFSDLPVSGQITAFAISGNRMTSGLSLGFFRVLSFWLKWQNNDLPGLLFQPSYLRKNCVV